MGGRVNAASQASLQFSGHWVVDRELQAAVCPLNSSLSSLQPSTLLVTLTPVQEVVSSYPLWLCSALNSDRATIHMAGVCSSPPLHPLGGEPAPWPPGGHSHL